MTKRCGGITSGNCIEASLRASGDVSPIWGLGTGAKHGPPGKRGGPETKSLQRRRRLIEG
eukprot:6344428-Pyramimonas_sp.AAC.1